MVVNSTKLIRTMKVVLAILITLGIIFASAVALYFKRIWDDPSKSFNTAGNYVFTDESGVSHEYNQGVISFLIVGLDSSEEREDDNMGYRADTIMVCVVDTDNNTASLVSIPRDTKARVQVLNAQGKPTKMVTTKINAAFSYGFSPDKFGYENTLSAVNELFNSTGVKINPISNYIGADMDDFVAIANLMGGVPVQLRQDIPGIGKAGEWVPLQGEKALEFVRIRKGKGLTGMDTDRTERQRDFIKAMAVRLQELGGRESIIRLYNDCVNNGLVKTNLTIEQVYALSASVENIDLDTVIFEMMPGYINDAEGEGYWHVNKTQLKTMVLDLFYNAQEGLGMPTAGSTSEYTKQPYENNHSTKTEYIYTSKSKKTTSKTSTKKKSTTKSSSKKTSSSKSTTTQNDETTKKTTTEETTTTKATQADSDE